MSQGADHIHMSPLEEIEFNNLMIMELEFLEIEYILQELKQISLIISKKCITWD